MRGICAAIAAGLLLFSLCGWQAEAQQRDIEDGKRAAGYTRETARLLELSDELYQSAFEGNRQLVFQYTQRLARLSAVPELRSAVGSAAGWRELDATARRLQQVILGGKPHAELWQASSRLMLAYDALAKSEQALWLNYEEVLKEDVRRVFLAWRTLEKHHAAAAVAALKPLEDHVRLIRPAALLEREVEQVEALQQSVVFARRLLEAAADGRADRSRVEPMFGALDAAIDRLFGSQHSAEAEPVFSPVLTGMPWRWTLLLSIIIISVLSFSGYRRYRYERERIVPRQPVNRD